MLEEHLIKKCKAGDGESFRQLLGLYKTKLFGYLQRFSDSQDTAEEMFQETLIKVWKGIKKYNEQKKFSSWLFTIAHNVAMDSLRHRKTNNKMMNIDEVDNQLFSASPDVEVFKVELLQQIDRCVNNLSEKQKTVFLLRQHGELTFKEIAQSIDEPLNTVLSHMRYAIKKIKKQLDEENEPKTRSVI